MVLADAALAMEPTAKEFVPEETDNMPSAVALVPLAVDSRPAAKASRVDALARVPMAMALVANPSA